MLSRTLDPVEKPYKGIITNLMKHYRVFFEEGDKVIPDELGRAMNLSRGGIFVDTDLVLDEGTYVNAHLDLGDAGRPVWVQGRVVRSKGKGVAMEFSHIESGRLGSFFYG